MDLRHIQHIVQYVEERFNQDISVHELEAIFHASYRHIQRVFKAVFKETIGAFQKRLKLETAYKKLIYSQDSIADIAYSVGYESPHAFSKAFKKQFNIAPTDARIGKIEVFKGFIQSAKDPSESAILREIIYLKPIKIYFQSIKTGNYENELINQLWDDIDAICLPIKDIKCYGIIVDQPLITDTAKCRYEAGVDKDPKHKDFLSKSIFGGYYAQYWHKGSYDTIEDTYRAVYFDWIFNSNFALDNAPIIEYYAKHRHNTVQESDYLTAILLPIKKG